MNILITFEISVFERGINEIHRKIFIKISAIFMLKTIKTKTEF
jgi:hypothetical protein